MDTTAREVPQRFVLKCGACPAGVDQDLDDGVLGDIGSAGCCPDALAFRRFVTGLALAIAGTVLVVGASAGGHGNVLGDVLGLVTAVLYGGHLICVSLLRRSTGTVEIMVWSGCVAAPLLLIVAIASGENLLAATWSGWLVLIGLAVVSHTFGQSLIAFALAHLAASFSSLTLLLQPVAAASLAWLILDERLDWQQGLGALVVLVETFVAREATRRPDLLDARRD